MAQLTKNIYLSALILKLSSCFHFVVVAVARLGMESHKRISPLYSMESDGANEQLEFVVMIIRLQIVLGLRNLLIAFSMQELSITSDTTASMKNST